MVKNLKFFPFLVLYYHFYEEFSNLKPISLSCVTQLLILVSLLIFETLFAENKEEKWPNGQIKKSYSVTSANKKSGSYKEFYENGQLKIDANYANNMLDGFYFEFFDDGKIKQESEFSNGQKNGKFKIFEKGLLVKEEVWKDGCLIFTFPKTPEEIRGTILSIAKLKTEFIGLWPKDFNTERFTKAVEEDNIAGLTKLREYRYLCRLPYDDIKINRDYIAHNLDATIVLKKIGGITHYPTNPGLPEDLFKSGYKGTSSSNLCYTYFKVTSPVTIDMYMDDSDATNISRVGHRRWCLSPTMKTTGFATLDGFAAMWSINLDRTDFPELETICFPAKGYMPISHFKSNSAWSVSLNPKRYKEPAKSVVKVKIYLVNKNLNEEINIFYQNIETSYIGINNCIIFQPEKILAKPMSRYFVSITGIKDIKNKDVKFEYYVEFF